MNRFLSPGDIIQLDFGTVGWFWSKKSGNYITGKRTCVVVDTSPGDNTSREPYFSFYMGGIVYEITWDHAVKWMKVINLSKES
jgi:hypothetical protein